MRTLLMTLMLGSMTIDATAEKIILYGAAFTALGLFWRAVLKPGVHILRRTAHAVEALESLPKWRELQEAALAAVESEVAIVQSDVLRVQNEVAAIRRKLGVADKDVRAHPRP